MTGRPAEAVPGDEDAASTVVQGAVPGDEDAAPTVVQGTVPGDEDAGLPPAQETPAYPDATQASPGPGPATEPVVPVPSGTVPVALDASVNACPVTNLFGM